MIALQYAWFSFLTFELSIFVSLPLRYVIERSKWHELLTCARYVCYSQNKLDILHRKLFSRPNKCHFYVTKFFYRIRIRYEQTNENGQKREHTAKWKATPISANMDWCKSVRLHSINSAFSLLIAQRIKKKPYAEPGKSAIRTNQMPDWFAKSTLDL